MDFIKIVKVGLKVETGYKRVTLKLSLTNKFEQFLLDTFSVGCGDIRELKLKIV